MALIRISDLPLVGSVELDALIPFLENPDTEEARTVAATAQSFSDAITAAALIAQAAAEAAQAAAEAAQTAAELAETNAETAETNAETAETNAEAAQAAAEAALDAFTDIYLGSKAADPTLDNDGNPLVDGALYFNTTTNTLKVYDLGTTTWINAPPNTFLDLTDTPNSYSGHGSKVIQVNAGETGLEFGVVLSTTFQPLDSDLTSWAAITRASGFDTFVTTPSSANLRSLLTDEKGTGAALFELASDLTWGTGSGFAWTFDAGATDPVLTFGSGTVVLTSSTFDVSNSTMQILASQDSYAHLDLKSWADWSDFRWYRRNGTKALPTIVSANNPIGAATGYGYDGAVDIAAASIAFYVDGTPGTNDMPGRITFSTTADGAATYTDRWIIDSAGALKPATTASFDIGTSSLLVNNAWITALELGHASDTTITRVSAGVVAIEGVNILTTATGQPLDAELTALAGLTSAADKLPYFTGSGTAALADLSSAMRTFMTTPSSANLASLVSDDQFSLSDVELGAIAGLVSAADKFPYFTGSGTAALADLSSAMRTFLTTPSMANLGALLTNDASGWTTFGTTPSSANLAALVTDDLFSLADAELGAIAGLTSAADKLPYFTGSGTAALADLSSAMRTFLTTSSVANFMSVLTDDASGLGTFLTTPSCANLASLLTDDLFQLDNSALNDLRQRWTAASASGPAGLAFREDTDNGTSAVTLSAPASLAADRAVAFQDLAGTLALIDAEDQTLSGGARVTVKDLGNLSGTTITPDPGDRPIQKITNNGAGTIAPGSNNGAYILIVKNTSGAGAITTSGWQDVSGESFDTTTTSEFVCHCVITSDLSALVINKVA